MPLDLAESVAQAMETDVRLLPLLPELLTDLIRQRASLVRASHPAFEQLIDKYVARQERETQILGTDVRCAIWALRKV